VNSSTCKTLEDVLAWAHATDGQLVDVIVQDEYTHDVLVRIPLAGVRRLHSISGSNAGYIVFDTT